MVFCRRRGRMQRLVIAMFNGDSTSAHFRRFTMKSIQIGAKGEVQPLETG
jgi:hypothetical protein